MDKIAPLTQVDTEPQCIKPKELCAMPLIENIHKEAIKLYQKQYTIEHKKYLAQISVLLSSDLG